jgi:hypothetical protein
MNSHWQAVVRALVFILIGGACCNAGAQDDAAHGSADRDDRVLHIQRTVTTSQSGFPQSLFMYHVLDGANSKGIVQALKGTLALRNNGSEFSEVLWVLAYWNGECPLDDQSLAGANILWTEIQKNPTQSQDTLSVDLHFPNPLPMTGCMGFIFAGGPLVDGAPAVTMSADLNLEYKQSDSPANTVLDLSGEYCFGQTWGCQNATANDTQGFAVPITMLAAGHLVELYGDISDSTFDGTQSFGPLPTGEVWGAANNVYLLPGGCGQFGNNLNSQGFPNPVPLNTLNSWLPGNALHLQSVPLDHQIAQGRASRASLTTQVETLLPYPVKVNAGDCIVVFYGRKGNGATDNETQVHAVLMP